MASQQAKNLLFTEIKLDVKTGEIPGVGKFELGVDFDSNFNVGLSTILGEIKAQTRQGDQTGINLLYLLVLSRAFPQLSEAEKLTKIGKIFAGENTLKQLCEVSGGHGRNLLIILNSWIIKENKFPLSSAGLEAVVVNQVAGQTAQITPDEWELLNRVHQTKDSSGDRDFSKLIRTLLVYEYRDDRGAWYEVNPILFRTGKIK